MRLTDRSESKGPSTRRLCLYFCWRWALQIWQTFCPAVWGWSWGCLCCLECSCSSYPSRLQFRLIQLPLSSRKLCIDPFIYLRHSWNPWTLAAAFEVCMMIFTHLIIGWIWRMSFPVLRFSLLCFECSTDLRILFTRLFWKCLWDFFRLSSKQHTS